MERREFTMDEANAMTAELNSRFFTMMQLDAAIRARYRRLQQNKLAPATGDFDVDPPGATSRDRRDLQQLRALVDTLNEQLAELRAEGVIVKSIERGHVEWPTRIDGDEAFLCWKFGESSVAHWRTSDERFTERRPLGEAEEA
jgi:hypothetical protein